MMDKFAIVRSVTHPDAGHESASHYLLTGYRPTNDIPAQEMPSYGSITAQGTRTAAAGPAGLRRGARPRPAAHRRATWAWPTTRSQLAATRTRTTSRSAT